MSAARYNSPLFKSASREVQRALRTSLDRTALGKLASEMRTAQNAGQAKYRKLERALQAYTRGGGTAEVLRQLRGTGFGQFAQELAKYSRQPSLKQLIAQFLSDLGPAGKLLKALSDYGAAPTRDSIEAIAALARGYGMETLLPKGLRGKFKDLDRRSIQAAIKRLQEEGYTVVGPGERLPEPAPMPGTPNVQHVVTSRGFERHPPGGEGIRRDVSGYGNLPPNHPLLTGDMVPAPGSSNVHSYGYDIESNTLYVRYLGGKPDQRGVKHEPGALYAYYRVPPRVFLAMMDAASKGTFVWDELRIRGTLSLHHYSYELVGIVGGYVPRQAQAYFDAEKNRIVEGWFKRRIRGTSGNEYVSKYENIADVDAESLPPHFRGLDRGHQPWSPLRGTPNRPDDGQGYRR